jgi:hypothetical protein
MRIPLSNVNVNTISGGHREQQERCGYDIFLAQHQITSMPTELSRRSMRLFGEAVIPQFAALGV